MKPAAFNYHRPQSVDAALGLLARYGDDAKPIAGGQSLGPMLNMRLARPGHVVDLNDLLELDYVRRVDDWLEIGALTRHHRVATSQETRASHPLLAAAAASIGHYPIRQRGTLGGSVAHADPAAQLPLIAILTGAQILLQSVTGSRTVPAEAFFQSVMTVDIHPGEIITGVRFPQLAHDTGWAFEMMSRRRGDFAIVAIAVLLETDDAGSLSDLKIAIGGAAAVPMRLDVASDVPGAIPTDEWIKDLGQRVANAISPDDDVRMPAIFRKELAAELTEKAIRVALTRTKGGKA